MVTQDMLIVPPLLWPYMFPCLSDYVLSYVSVDRCFFSKDIRKVSAGLFLVMYKIQTCKNLF